MVHSTSLMSRLNLESQTLKGSKTPKTLSLIKEQICQLRTDRRWTRTCKISTTGSNRLINKRPRIKQIPWSTQSCLWPDFSPSLVSRSIREFTSASLRKSKVLKSIWRSSSWAQKTPILKLLIFRNLLCSNINQFHRMWTCLLTTKIAWSDLYNF